MLVCGLLPTQTLRHLQCEYSVASIVSAQQESYVWGRREIMPGPKSGPDSILGRETCFHPAQNLQFTGNGRTHLLSSLIPLRPDFFLVSLNDLPMEAGQSSGRTQPSETTQPPTSFVTWKSYSACPHLKYLIFKNTQNISFPELPG